MWLSPHNAKSQSGKSTAIVSLVGADKEIFFGAPDFDKERLYRFVDDGMNTIILDSSQGGIVSIREDAIFPFCNRMMCVRCMVPWHTQLLGFQFQHNLRPMVEE